MSDAPRVVAVEIQGQRYAIRSSLDAGYIADLAEYVEGKLQAASDATPTGDSIKIAVLAALNIADEFFRCRDSDQVQSVQILERTRALERLVDGALAKVQR